MKIKTVLILWLTVLSHRQVCSQSNEFVAPMDSVYTSLNPTAKPQQKTKWEVSLDILSFYRNLGFRSELQTLNPNNRVAELDKEDFGFYFRPAAKLTWKNLSAKIEPRWNTEYNEISKRYEINNGYFQRAIVDFQIHQKIKAKAGRYFKSIGTSTIINPSNPFFIETVSLNQKLEIQPMEFTEVNLNLLKGIKLSIIGNLGCGESKYFKNSLFDFSRKYAIQTEYYGNSFQIGTILSANEAKRWSVGLYAQRNLGDAVVTWVDAALDHSPYRFYPQVPQNKKIAQLINYEMVDGDFNQKLFFRGLWGISYTFKTGPTLNLEYYHNGMGYDNSLLNDYQKMVYSASDYTFNVTRELSKLNLGRAINSGMPFFRKNYVFSQAGQNDIWGKLNYFVRYFKCLDDNSQQYSALMEWEIHGRLEIYSMFLISDSKNIHGDFSKLIQHQIMTGLIYRL